MTRPPGMAMRLALVLLVLAFAGSAGRADMVPEPDGYRMEDYRSPMPATLKGAEVLDTAAAAALWKDKAAVFIDVMPRPPKPAKLPAGTLWRDPPRDSLPGAIWLANVGFGGLSPEADAYFRRGLEAATDGDRDKRLVFFCLRDCWMSWNAAKRAMDYGYRKVAWFPDGADGWVEAGLPLERVEPWSE